MKYTLGDRFDQEQDYAPVDGNIENLEFKNIEKIRQGTYRAKKQIFVFNELKKGRLRVQIGDLIFDIEVRYKYDNHAAFTYSSC